MASEAKPQNGFTLSPENHAAELKLVISPNPPSPDALELRISQKIAALQLAVPIDTDALRQACQAAVKGERAVAVVARGVAPVHGADGQLVWSKKIAGASVQGRNVSHYLGRLEKRIVAKGDPLAKIIPETPGTDGKDIYGKVLKAAKGKPLKIKTGPNTREQDGIFFADKDGLVRLEGGKIMIDEVFLVEGNLTFEVGNVDFPGSVVVRGGVLDLFEVKAGGSVQIDGLVEAAKITAGGDVEIKGGVEGKKKGAIHCRGSVRAKFLVNADVFSRKDVCVETQIITSKVVALGAVKAPGGAIAGGDVTALGGIIANTIGSESAAATAVTAGVNPMLGQVVSQADAVIDERKKKLAALDKEACSYRGRESTATIRQRLTEIGTLKAESAELIAAAEKRRNEAVAFTHDAARPVIVVKTAIHPGVTIRLANVKSTVSETLCGPLKVVPDVHKGVLRFLPTSL